MRIKQTSIIALSAALLAFSLPLGSGTASAATLGPSATTGTVKGVSSDFVEVGYRRDKHRRYGHRYHRYDRDYVDAPYTRYRSRGRVVVDAPYAHVKRGRRGVHVRAPFVDLFVPRW